MTMAEYIVNINEDVLGEFDFIAITTLKEIGIPVVRCRDCASYDMAEPNNEDCPISYRCTRVNRLWREPDDFCKRAERKDE